MIIHVITGFLGSGKTTAIYTACKALIHAGKKAGIITNDQGSRLVDGGFLDTLGLPGREVRNGCFCCNYNDLENHIRSLSESNKGTDVIFAESVGSCTDIVATVIKPLQHYFPGSAVTFSTFSDVRLLQMILSGNHAFDDDVTYIYRKQLEESSIIVVNKIDLVDPPVLKALREQIDKALPGKTLLFQNSLDEQAVLGWLTELDEQPAPTSLSSLSVDYDRYAAGEAKMGWLDEALEIISPDEHAMEACQLLVERTVAAITGRSFPIGHLKFLADEKHKVSITSPGEKVPHFPAQPAGKATLLINLRVQVDARILEQLVAAAIDAVKIETGCNVLVMDHAAFQPGYPQPTHRF